MEYPFPLLPGGPVTHQHLLYALQADLRELCICPGPNPPRTQHFKKTVNVVDILTLSSTYSRIDFTVLQNGMAEVGLPPRKRPQTAEELSEVRDAIEGTGA